MRQDLIAILEKISEMIENSNSLSRDEEVIELSAITNELILSCINSNYFFLNEKSSFTKEVFKKISILLQKIENQDQPNQLQIKFLRFLYNSHREAEIKCVQLRGAHKKIVNHGKTLGYGDELGGCCNGLTLMWIEASMTNEENIFQTNIALLTQSEDPEKLDSLFTKLFYKEIFSYQSPSKYITRNYPNISQFDVEALSTLAGSEKIKSIGGMKEIYKTVNFYDNHTFIDLLEKIKEAALNSEYEDQDVLGLTISTHNHMMGATYSIEMQSWKFFNSSEGQAIFIEKGNEHYIFEGILNHVRSIEEDQELQGTPLAIKVISTFDHPCANKLAHYMEQLPRQYNIEWQALDHANIAKMLILASALDLVDVIESADKAKIDLARKISIGEDFSTSIAEVSAQFGSMLTLEYFVDKKIIIFDGSEESKTAICTASKNGMLNALEYLVSAGASAEAKNKEQTPMHMAALTGQSVIIYKLYWMYHACLDPVNEFGASPLILAAKNGDAETVDLLLNLGASPNIVTHKDKYSALHFAVLDHHLGVITALACSQEANFCLRDQYGFSALDLAVRLNHEKSVIALLESGKLDVNTKEDSTKLTPIFFAANYGHSKMVELLISRGADLFCKNIDSKTPIDYAKNDETANIIMKYKVISILKEHALLNNYEKYGISNNLISKKIELFIQFNEKCLTFQSIKLGMLIDRAEHYFDHIHKSEKATMILFWTPGCTSRYNEARHLVVTALKSSLNIFLDIDVQNSGQTIEREMDKILATLSQYERDISTVRKSRHFNDYTTWKTENEAIFINNEHPLRSVSISL